METSPPIDDDIIKLFKSTFEGKPNTQTRLIYDELRKPDICSTIISCNATRNHWYNNKIDQETNTSYIDDIEMNNIIDYSIKERIDASESKLDEMIKFRQLQLDEKNKLQLIQQERDENKKKHEDLISKELQKIENYIVEFNENNGRSPFQDEIYSNLKDIVNAEAIERFNKTNHVV